MEKLSPSSWESTEIHLCHVRVFTGGLEMRRRWVRRGKKNPVARAELY